MGRIGILVGLVGGVTPRLLVDGWYTDPSTIRAVSAQPTTDDRRDAIRVVRPLPHPSRATRLLARPGAIACRSFPLSETGASGYDDVPSGLRELRTL